MLTNDGALINMNDKERMIYMFGNLVGTGKNEGGKLYCVTVNSKYSFYSSTQINDVNDFKNYLEIKGTIRVFGVDGGASSTNYRVDGISSIEYYSQTDYYVHGFRITGTYSNKYYQGGTANNFSEGHSFASSTILCYEV